MFSSALRKTSHILLGLSRLVETEARTAPITYYALDLEKHELERTLSEIDMSDIGRSLKGKVDAKGICGTYDQGLKFAKSGGLESAHDNGRERISREPASSFKFDIRDPSPASSLANSVDSENTPPSTPEEIPPPLHLLFLGSSLGNFARGEGAEFLKSLPLRPGSGDTLLIGLDHDNEKELIEEAYNDREGHTRKFIFNGLKGAGKALGDENMFDENNWEYVNVWCLISFPKLTLIMNLEL